MNTYRRCVVSSVFVCVHLWLGMDFVHRNSTTPQKHLLETMGGGVALLDFDNDGRLDVFFVNGAELPVLKHSGNKLYRQRPDGSFEDVTAHAGVSQQGHAVYGMGVATGDFDNDGFSDLYVTGYPRNTLFHNNGDGTFTDVTASAGVSASGWSASAGFFDYDNDGRLDLFVTRYLDWDLARSIPCGGPALASYCNPDRFGPVSNLLFRNNGDGTFTDVSASSGIARWKGKGLGVAFSGSDIFVANDGMEQFLFHHDGGGRFSERAMEAGVALSGDGKPFAGMGTDFGDYDNDGRPDLIVTNLASEVYALYHNEGGGLYRYTSLGTGLAAVTSRHSGWGVKWFDFDNDGWQDLFVAQGHVLDTIERIDPSRKYREPPALMRNVRGRFERVPLPEARAVAARGAAFGDLNNDGSVDIVLTVLGGRPVIFPGKPNGNHWLLVELQGTRSNRDGFGARVTVNGQVRECTAAGSYLSASDKRLHFGLGRASEAAVAVSWPGGGEQVLQKVRVDQILRIKEPQ